MYRERGYFCHGIIFVVFLAICFISACGFSSLFFRTDRALLLHSAAMRFAHATGEYYRRIDIMKGKQYVSSVSERIKILYRFTYMMVNWHVLRIVSTTSYTCMSNHFQRPFICALSCYAHYYCRRESIPFHERRDFGVQRRSVKVTYSWSCVFTFPRFIRHPFFSFLRLSLSLNILENVHLTKFFQSNSRFFHNFCSQISPPHCRTIFRV